MRLLVCCKVVDEVIGLRERASYAQHIDVVRIDNRPTALSKASSSNVLARRTSPPLRSIDALSREVSARGLVRFVCNQHCECAADTTALGSPTACRPRGTAPCISLNPKKPKRWQKRTMSEGRALPLRSRLRRGRLLPRHHRLPNLLVSLERAGHDGRLVHRSHSCFVHHRCTVEYLDHG